MFTNDNQSETMIFTKVNDIKEQCYKSKHKKLKYNESFKL